LASLDLIREETRAEREAQLRHFDGLDAKAGILIELKAGRLKSAMVMLAVAVVLVAIGLGLH
jgi:hypothetical protein